MKARLITYMGVVLLLVCCKTEIITPVDFYVTLDKKNTLKAGEPVKFDLHGESDYYMFYSGEQGHEYRYKDREEVALADINSASFTISSTPERYGYQGDFISFWLSDSFEGLTGDRETDIATMDAEVADGMSRWKRLDFTPGADFVAQTDEYDISDYLDHFCFAVHYNPSRFRPGSNNTPQQQPLFNMSASLLVDIEGVGTRKFSLPNMERAYVFMNRDEQGRPYEVVQRAYSYWTYSYYYSSVYEGQTEIRTHWPTDSLSDEDKAKLTRVAAGGVAFGWSQGDIRFVGSNANQHHFNTDIWIVYSPIKLNSVERDTGEVIKNLQNDVYKYEYTYAEPGYYKAVFHGFNVTIDKRYDKIIEIPVIITE